MRYGAVGRFVMRKINQANMIGRLVGVQQGICLDGGMADVRHKGLHMLRVFLAYVFCPAASLVAVPTSRGVVRPGTGTMRFEHISSNSPWSRDGRRRAIVISG